MRRVLRGILLALAGLVLAVGFSVATTTTASAAGDQIDRFSIEYEMGTDGVLQAKETIVWRFGSDSGRHGIDRYFVTREPYDDEQDAVYTVDIESVTSPDSVLMASRAAISLPSGLEEISTATGVLCCTRWASTSAVGATRWSLTWGSCTR